MKKTAKNTVLHLIADAMQHLLAQPDRNSPKGRRDLTLLSTLYDSGCRVQELADLRVLDVILDNPSVLIITGKGNKVRRVPLMKNTLSLLKQYITENSLDKPWRNDYPLFVNKQHNKLT